MSDFKLSFITRETDSVNNEEVKVAFPSITCIWTSVNILCYGLILIFISWLTLTERYTKSCSWLAIQPGGLSYLACLFVYYTIMDDNWASVQKHAKNEKKKYKKQNGQYPAITDLAIDR